MTLKAKLQALFALLILSMVGLVVAWTALLADQSVGDRLRRDVEGATRVLGSSFSERRELLSDQAKLLAEPVDAQVALQGRDRGAKKTTQLRSATRSDAVLLLDGSGRVKSQKGLHGLIEKRTTQVIHKASASRRTWTGVVSSDRALYLAASAPIVEGRRLMGTVVVLSAINAQFAKRLRDSTGADIVFIRNGKVAASSTSATKGLPTTEGQARTLKIEGVTYAAKFHALPGAKVDEKIGFVAIQEVEGVVAPLRSLGVMFVTGLLVALALAIVLTGLFARSLTRPLDALLKAASEVREGRWPEPLRIAAQDEIGTLQAEFNDMTASLKSSHNRLLSMLDVDPLTDLDNHRRFKERLDQEVFRASLNDKPLTVALFDLDRFGEYNGTHGPVAGDEALRKFAAILRANCPDVAFLGRYGGEEFAVMLPMNSLDSTEALAERIRSKMSGQFVSPITVSVGIADMRAGINSGSGLLLSAELALSRAKQLGKDRVCRFDAVPGASGENDPFQLQKYLEDSSFAAIQALAGAVDAKDPYTQGHSLRVARFASDLARYMSESRQFVEIVYRTGTLHDVGKIGVPDTILTKPTRLEPEELAIMETHPVLGELIVKKAPQLDEMLPGVRHHHERWDGRGYPDRLMGDEIPKLARYIAIADTFDAMTSERPYRAAMSVEVALEEITRCAGTQFEPALALSFVRMMRLHGQTLKAA